ncbi:MAG: TonB-dependent receptor [bacterium]|nr:TonB-dependent receptor [bacterium]
MTRPLIRGFVVLAALVMVAGTATAQPTGTGGPATTRTAVDPLAPCTIKGRIFDAESGETMPYTNVFIAGTNSGTMAFTDGFYILRGLRAGTYTVKASYISYAVGTKTLTLAPGEVVNLDFHLEVQAILADALEIAAERALIEVDRTGSSHFLSADQLSAMPLDQMVDMIALQPGVTMQDNEIHIRGGRADDTSFIVDGMSVNDPLGGGGYGYQMDPAIINEIEVLTGGFNAEHGQAVSGVVNVSTKEGNDYLEGRVSFKRDYLFSPVPKDDYLDWRNYTDFSEPQNIDIVKASLSGPDPIAAGLRRLGLGLPGKQYLLASGSLETKDGHLPIFSLHDRLSSPMYDERFWTPRADNNWNGMLKWTWVLDADRKFNLNLSRNVSISQGFDLGGEGFPFTFMDRLGEYLVFTNENILTQAYYRQVLGEKSWFEVTLGRSFTRQHSNVNGNDDFTTYEPFRRYSLLSTGSADRWHDHYAESYTLKGAYTFMGGGHNEFKTGMELSHTGIQLVDLAYGLSRPLPGRLGVREDIFVAHPVTGAAYFQDKVDYRGLILNAGVRADFWAPGREVEAVMADPDQYLFITHEMATEFDESTFDALERAWKARLSPRLGLSFKVTERDKFFFNYGHFSQWPRFLYVYPQLTANTAADVQLLGNPNLDPKITVEYETGIQHEFGGLWSAGVTFFNRDIFDYAKSVRMNGVSISPDQTPDPNDTESRPISPVRYFNGDSARSLGVEISIVKRTTRWLAGSASLELQRSTGTNSSADEAYLQTLFGDELGGEAGLAALTRSPLLWDKPWAFSLNADFAVDDRNRPVLFGWRLPPDWSLNVLFQAEAGQRFKRTRYLGPRDYVTETEYSGIGPTKSSLNLRLNKFWRFGERERLTFSLEVRNLFNHRNYRRVNQFTGEGFRLGDYNPEWTETPPDSDSEYVYSTDSAEYARNVVDPSHIEDPLTILWGVSYSW